MGKPRTKGDKKKEQSLTKFEKLLNELEKVSAQLSNPHIRSGKGKKANRNWEFRSKR